MRDNCIEDPKAGRALMECCSGTRRIHFVRSHEADLKLVGNGVATREKRSRISTFPSATP